MPAQQSILVLAPHPDDESLGCGGTLKMLTQVGAAVDVLLCTRGENGHESHGLDFPLGQGELAETREAEVRAACTTLGVREVAFLDGSDGRLSEQLDLAVPLARHIGEGGYQRIFAPWYGEAHPDHIATFRILQQALRLTGGDIGIWLYEVWSPLMPNTLVPIDGTIVAKRQAILAHQSQLACLDYLTGSIGLASYRALACPPSKFAEAFLVMDRQQVLAIG